MPENEFLIEQVYFAKIWREIFIEEEFDSKFALLLNLIPGTKFVKGSILLMNKEGLRCRRLSEKEVRLARDPQRLKRIR